MKLIPLAFLVTTVAAFAAEPPTVVERRKDAVYSGPDWTKSGPDRYYDAPPVPVDGMHSLVSHLTYPSELRRKHIGGTVIVRITVDATGRLREVTVLQSAGSQLDHIVVDAVRRTRWKPATKNHSPVAASGHFPLTFTPPK